MSDFAVTILADHEAGDGFELLGVFHVEAPYEEDAVDRAFDKAREMHPEVGDMQLDSVSAA
ncbi:hypothetical protein ASF74_14825 [Arthrobacter sp. Leaf145]|nr:hypothetical protein ASF74_14825 [Arthrobacter sp. Leaf145]